MSISFKDYLRVRDKDWSADPVHALTLAMLKASKVPRKPGRTDLRKAKGFITLYEFVSRQLPESYPQQIQAETERLWERTQLAWKTPAIQRKLKQMIKARQ